MVLVLIIKLDHEEMKKHYTFINKLKTGNANIRRSYLRVYDKDYRGLHASTDINIFENILSIPISMSISHENLINEYEIGKKLQDRKVFTNRWKRFIFPLIYVVKELKNPKSRYKEWLSVFPKQASSHPMFFNEEERKWLKGSTTVEKLDNDLKMIRDFYKRISEVDEGFDVEFETFLNFYYVLCSRYFGLTVNDKKVTLLVPYADFINTGRSNDKNAYWFYESSTNTFKVGSNNFIKAGDPIMFCYGHNSNFTYFTYYGIALDYREFDCVCFMLKFDSSIPNYKLKAQLLNSEDLMIKRARFYADYKNRVLANMHFMAKWRFYLSKAEATVLINVNVQSKVSLCPQKLMILMI